MEKLLALSLVILWLQLASELGLLVMGRGWPKFRAHKIEGQNLFNWEKWKVKVLVPQSCLFSTQWTIACQAPLSVEFSRQQYWSGLPFPAPGDLPNPGIKFTSPAFLGRFFTTVPPGKPVNWEMYPQIMEGNANTSEWKCSDWLLASVLVFLPRGE